MEKIKLFLILIFLSAIGCSNAYCNYDSDLKKIESDINKMIQLAKRLDKRERNNFTDSEKLYVLDLSFSLSLPNYLTPELKNQIRQEFNKVKNERLYYSEREISAYNRDFNDINNILGKYGCRAKKSTIRNPKYKGNNSQNTPAASIAQNTLWDKPTSSAESNFMNPREEKLSLPDNEGNKTPEFDLSKLEIPVKANNREIKEIIDFCRQMDAVYPSSFCTCVQGKFTEKTGKDITAARSQIDKSDEEKKNIKAFNDFLLQISDKINSQINEIDREYKYLAMATLSDNVYDRGVYPDGWKLVDSSDNTDSSYMKVTKTIENLSDFNGKNIGNDGFFAEIYYNKDLNEYTLAFRGSEPPNPLDKTKWMDWVNNIQQARGSDYFKMQYDKAYYLTQSLVAECKGCKINITGHSLGGGMASFVGYTFGLETYTYNAAAVNPQTIKEKGKVYDSSDKKKNIKAYYIENEVLRGINEYTNKKYGTVELGEQISLGASENFSLTGTAGSVALGVALGIGESIGITDAVTETSDLIAGNSEMTGAAKTYAKVSPNNIAVASGAAAGAFLGAGYDMNAHYMESVFDNLSPKYNEYDNKVNPIKGIKQSLQDCNSIIIQ